MSHEHSYQHDLDNVIDASDAVLAIGIEKVDTTTLKDRALSNDATIHGAMPSNGYFLGRRFTAANENYLDCGNIIITGDEITLISIVKTFGAGEIISKSITTANQRGYRMYGNDSKNVSFFICNDGLSATQTTITSNTGDIDKISVVICEYDGSTMKLFINGSENVSVEKTGNVFNSSQNTAIALNSGGGYGDCIVMYSYILYGIITDVEKTAFFNSIARLPLYSHNFERYPNSDTSLTSVFPYTSGIITSGSFNKTNGLKCTSAGQIVFSNSFEFDGSEYITLTINGVEYSGTTTVTQGTITATIAQGSNDITIDMSTNDVLEDIQIQFRSEV